VVALRREMFAFMAKSTTSNLALLVLDFGHPVSGNRLAGEIVNLSQQRISHFFQDGRCLFGIADVGDPSRRICSKSYAKRHQGSSGAQARLEPIVRRPRPQCYDLVLCRAHWLVPTPQFIRHRLLEERNPGFHHFFWDMESQYRRLCVPLCQPPK
jgi:hypothetical protein